MSDYIAIVEVDDGKGYSEIRDMLYLVDQEGYFLMCAMQRTKPTKETLKIVLDWLVDQHKAVKLQHRPIQLWFAPVRKNMRVDDP